MNTGDAKTLDFHDIPIVHFPDRGARWLLQFADNVEALLDIPDSELAEKLDFERLAEMNRTLLSETLRQQESDIIYSVPFRETPAEEGVLIYLMIEHQSRVDPTMAMRFFIYMAHLWDRRRQQWDAENVPRSQWRFPPIIPILFYTGDTAWQRPVSLPNMMDIPLELARFVPSFEMLVLDVKAADVSELTRGNRLFGWLMSVVQQEKQSAAALRETLEQALLGLAPFSVSNRAAYEDAIGYLILLILHRPASEEHEPFVGFLAARVRDMEVRTVATSMAEQLMQQGRQQGRSEGLELGRIAEKQAAILKLIPFRFQTFPETLVHRTQAIEDLEALDILFDSILTAESIEDIVFPPDNNGGA